ncbi:MAG: DUF4185 domain-containing protein [Verrucomicrobia bacterium]|nr:DUF4185 domain-containing protein [Verrucomicrobiota bacterium]
MPYLIIWFVGVFTLLTAFSSNSFAGVLTGPVTNSANNHIYYLLEPSTWSQAETEARTLGGHLASINDASEQDWIYTTFSNFGAVQRHLWIGLYDANRTINSANRETRRGEFVWINGEASTYSNWSPVEPGASEQAVHIWYPGDLYSGKWNDLNPNLTNLNGAPLCGVVEVNPVAANLNVASVIPTAVPEIVYVAGSAQKISQLTGDFDKHRGQPTENLTQTRYQLAGTDLGVPFTHKGRTYLLFGDTEGGLAGSRDSIAYSTDTNLADGLALTFLTNASGVWRPLTIPGITQGSYEVPADGVSISNNMYVYHTTDHSALKTMGRSVLAVSEDDGQTFTQLYTLSTRHFINVSVVKAAAEDWPGSPHNSGESLYLFGAGNYRDSNVRLAFQSAGSIESASSLLFFAGLNDTGAPLWSVAETNAAPLFDNSGVGEFSVAYNHFLGRWLMLYNSDYPRGINFRTAPTPWGPWSDPQVLFEPWTDGGYCNFIHTSWSFANCDSVHDTGHQNTWGGEYGPYLFKDMAEGSNGFTRIYFTMSTWNPYTVVLMRADLRRQTNSDVALLVPTRGIWRYLDNGSDQGTAWRQTNFNDITWRLGQGEFGYGDGDEKTVVQSGPAGARFITTYFRRQFKVIDPAAFSSLTLRLRRDDGAVVYLNGQEVFRSNLPAGTVTYTTLALTDVTGSNERAFFSVTLSPTNLLAGTNLVAVELHQFSPQSDDASFDLELSATHVSPILRFNTGPGGTTLTWAPYYPAHVLEARDAFLPDSPWQRIAQPKLFQGNNYTHSINPTNASRFYRLSRE